MTWLPNFAYNFCAQKIPDEFMQEVANARVYDGVHFRNSTDVGTSVGRKVGEAVAEKTLR